MLSRVQGIVLKTYAQGEDDLILELMTKQAGLLRVLSPRAKKQTTSYSAVTQVLVVGDYILQQGITVNVMRQASMIDSYGDLRVDVMTLAYAQAMLELCLRVQHNARGTMDSMIIGYSLYDHLIASLARLRMQRSPSMALVHLQVLALVPLGIIPSYSICASCQQELQFDANHYSFIYGGFLCASCAAKGADKKAVVFQYKARSIMQKLSQIPVSFVGEVRVKADVEKEIRTFLTLYFREYAGISLRSLEVIEQLE